jgi:hypothetical protein
LTFPVFTIQVLEVIVATNNHYKGQAAVNAIDLKRLLGVKRNPAHEELQRAYPQLKGGAAKAPKREAPAASKAAPKQTPRSQVPLCVDSSLKRS